MLIFIINSFIFACGSGYFLLQLIHILWAVVNSYMQFLQNILPQSIHLSIARFLPHISHNVRLQILQQFFSVFQQSSQTALLQIGHIFTAVFSSHISQKISCIFIHQSTVKDQWRTPRLFLFHY